MIAIVVRYCKDGKICHDCYCCNKCGKIDKEKCTIYSIKCLSGEKNMLTSLISFLESYSGW